jgi:hypothetical protein
MPARRSPRKSVKQRPRHGPLHDKRLTLTLKAIETERDNLSRAESVLGCLQVAMEYDEMHPRSPYYPDVTEIARQMLRRSINALDPINLPARRHDRVKEEFCACAGAVASASGVLSLKRVFFSPRYSPRLHRRDYSRASANHTSRRDCASENIAA